jgi:mannose-6-phosphate isomerase
LTALPRLKDVVSVEYEIIFMAIERAREQSIPKPWGIVDLHPWSTARNEGKAIGEIRYERSSSTASDSLLLLKLLFTSQPLSIQVHPDDADAHAIGLPRGKSEAWYILSAAPDAKIALGLKQRQTPQQLREAIDDGSISKLVVWQPVSQGEVIFVPAGTIHAIGAGLVIAEIQQRSDATFRIFDYGRERELHIDSAVAVANAGPAALSTPPSRISNERTLLVSSPHFVFERIDLQPNSDWCLAVERESWLLVLSGGARVGSFDVDKGEAIFAQSDRVAIHVGTDGMMCLAAYTGSVPVSHLLQSISEPDAIDSGRPGMAQISMPFAHPKAGLANGDLEVNQ